MSPTSPANLFDIVLAVLFALMFLFGSILVLGLRSATKVLAKGHPLNRKYGLGVMLMAIGGALDVWPIKLLFPDWIPGWATLP